MGSRYLVHQDPLARPAQIMILTAAFACRGSTGVQYNANMAHTWRIAGVSHLYNPCYRACL